MKLPEHYTPANDLLKDRVIAVTGAGDGIGKTAAITFARYGATVILIGRTISKLEAVYDTIENNNGPQPAIYPIDFKGAIEKDYHDMYSAFDDAFGQIDGLLHNAAQLGPRTSIASYSTENWQELFQVNVHAPFMLSKALLPLLQKSDDSAIVFTGSSVGLKGRAYWGAYAASKAAAENLMQTLADEMEETSSIHINSVNPGATRTAMRADAYPAEDPESIKSTEALMPLYLYLISRDSKAFNGQQFS